MITVIADDLTGAAEVAGVCMRYGLKVAFGIDSVPNVASDVRVVATDSRSVSEEEAYRQHLYLTRQAVTSEEVLFKKTDSVLRGHVLAELDAFLQATGKKAVLLQPANPAVGRCIRNGNYFVGENLLHETGFSSDPDFPARSSGVSDLLLQRSPGFAQKKEWSILSGVQITAADHGIVIPDATSPDELAKPLNVFPNSLLAGSAAFFEKVLLHYFPNAKLQPTPKADITSDFLMIGGSTHPQGRSFVAGMKSAGCPVEYFSAEMLQEQESYGAVERRAEELIPIWKNNGKMILSISPENVKFPNSSVVLKSRMNRLVGIVLSRCEEVTEFLIEGGATAYSILSYLKWDTLIPAGELAPGVIRMQVSQRPSLYLTIKPGSYIWPQGIGD